MSGTSGGGLYQAEYPAVLLHDIQACSCHRASMISRINTVERKGLGDRGRWTERQREMKKASEGSCCVSCRGRGEERAVMRRSQRLEGLRKKEKRNTYIHNEEVQPAPGVGEVLYEAVRHPF